MKAILVLDEMPETCVECPCFERHEKDEWWCDAYGNYIGDEKPEWCPLKPMPEPKDVHLDFDEVIWDDETFEIKKLGWNACLKEIEK